MKQYEYMIIYHHEKGVGRRQVTRTMLIESYADVEGVEEAINKTESYRIMITDFKLLRVYKQ